MAFESSDLATQYGMVKLKNKEAIKTADVAKGVTSFVSKQRPQKMNKVEKLLLIFVKEKEIAGDSISEGVRGVMVIIVGNGHGNTSSNPGRDW